MVNDSATHCPAIATPGHAVEPKGMYPVVMNRLAHLRGQVECGEYEIDLAAIAAAMLGLVTCQNTNGG
jgi:anti-sigma28 factor (negative regulator of flagellin synthesis)